MPERPVICGIDVGVTHHGVAVVDTAVRAVQVVRTGRETSACALLVGTVLELIDAFRVTAVAVEDYHGRRIFTRAERPILLHTGALLSLEYVRPGLLVLTVPIQAWQDGIVSERPVPRRDGGTAGLWKQTVRRRVELQLQARGLRWEDPTGDPGGHKADAVGIALYAQDLLARARAVGGRA
jgi:hypothetical protein